MNEILKEILTTGSVEVNGSRRPVHSSVSLRVGMFLQQLIRTVVPSVSLEVGLGFGVSAMFICETLTETAKGRHIVIDPDQYLGTWGDGWSGAGLALLERCGLRALVDFHCLPSCRALPALEESGVRIDFAFVDGWHTFDYCLMDAVLIDRILNVNGIIVLHDAHWPSVHKVCRYLLTNRSYRVHSAVTTPHNPALRPLRRSASVPLVPEELRRHLKPEVRQPDEELDLPGNSPCVALQKMRDDDRRWDFHEEF